MVDYPLYITTIVTGLATASGELPHSMYSRAGASIDVAPSAMYYTGVAIDKGHFYSSNYREAESSFKELTEREVSINERLKALRRNFNRNSDDVSQKVQLTFSNLANKLSILPFNDNLSFFNVEDKSVDIKVMMSHDFCLDVSYFVEDDDYVVFTLHKGHKLLVADELQIEDFGSKAREFAKMFNDDEA